MPVRFLPHLLSILLLASFSANASTQVIDVRAPADLERATTLLATPNSGVDSHTIVRLHSGRYEITKTLRIARSNVSLFGEKGVVLHLADNANIPVIAIGSQTEYPLENERIHNIQISGIEIDGNKENQQSELVADKPWIRNNGIDIRMASEVLISRVSVSNNRSGGLVISWKAKDIQVNDSFFERNYFDGIAYYDSTRVYTTNCVMRNNVFAGISLDNAFAQSAFIGCRLIDNGAVGVFARNSRSLRFDDCTISGSGDWGVFLGHDEKEQGVSDILISNSLVVNNRGGINVASINEKQSKNIRVVKSRIHENSRDHRENVFTSGAPLWVCDDTIASGVIAAYEADRNPSEANKPNLIID